MKQKSNSSLPEREAIHEDRFADITQIVIIAIGVIFFIVLITLLIQNEMFSPFTFQLNIFAFLSAISLISNLLAFFLVTKSNQRSPALTWFSVFLISLAAWATSEMLVRSSTTPNAAAFWSSLSTLGSVVMPASLYLFALAYTDVRRSFNPYILPILILVSLSLVIIDTKTNLFTNYDPALMQWTPWGFVTATGPAYYLIALWIILITFAALFLLVHYLRTESLDPVLKRQTKMICIAIAIALIGGSLTDGLLPALNIVFLPPLSVILLSLMGIVISYGMYRDHAFIFTPDLIASEILSTMNEAVIATSPSFQINYANPGAERLLGYPTHELMTKKFAEFIGKNFSPEAEELRHDIVSGLNHENRLNIESINLECAEGRKVTTKLSISRIKGSGQPNGYLMVLTDITALAETKQYIEQQIVMRTKQLAEEQTRFLASINSLTLGFIFFDSNNNVLMSNVAMSNIMGDSDTDKERGHRRNKLLQQELNAQTAETTKLRTFVSNEVETDDSKIFHIVTTPVLALNNEVEGTVVLIEDITEAKIQERSKDEFFSIASHELRTPLTSIKGNTSMILDYYKKQLEDPNLREMVEDVHTSSIRLIDIVNDFLDVSRLEQGKVSFECGEADINEIIQKVSYEMKTFLDEKKITLNIDQQALSSAPRIWADKNRLQQVIYNLIGNAAKFTENGTITLKVEVDKSNKLLKLKVIDTGRGMTIESQQLLFRKFQQASSSLLTRDTTKGTGLGLYISKMIIEGMGGAIALEESAEGKGSTFSFTIPLAEGESKNKIFKTKTDSATGLTELA